MKNPKTIICPPVLEKQEICPGCGEPLDDISKVFHNRACQLLYNKNRHRLGRALKGSEGAKRRIDEKLNEIDEERINIEAEIYK